MTHNHNHDHCEHLEMAYCNHCRVAYCKTCGKEFYEKNYSWTYTNLQPTYTTYTANGMNGSSIVNCDHKL